MRIFNWQTEEFYEGEYQGDWYDGQLRPQTIYFCISKGNSWIYTSSDVGNGGCSPEVFHERTLRFALPSAVYSNAECEKILDDLKADCEAIQATYREVWNGGNLVGKWNDDLVERLQLRIDEIPSCHEFYDMEGE